MFASLYLSIVEKIFTVDVCKGKLSPPQSAQNRVEKNLHDQLLNGLYFSPSVNSLAFDFEAKSCMYNRSNLFVYSDVLDWRRCV